MIYNDTESLNSEASSVKDRIARFESLKETSKIPIHRTAQSELVEEDVKEQPSQRKEEEHVSQRPTDLILHESTTQSTEIKQDQPADSPSTPQTVTEQREQLGRALTVESPPKSDTQDLPETIAEEPEEPQVSVHKLVQKFTQPSETIADTSSPAQFPEHHVVSGDGLSRVDSHEKIIIREEIEVEPSSSEVPETEILASTEDIAQQVHKLSLKEPSQVQVQPIPEDIVHVSVQEKVRRLEPATSLESEHEEGDFVEQVPQGIDTEIAPHDDALQTATVITTEVREKPPTEAEFAVINQARYESSEEPLESVSEQRRIAINKALNEEIQDETTSGLLDESATGQRLEETASPSLETSSKSSVQQFSAGREGASEEEPEGFSEQKRIQISRSSERSVVDEPESQKPDESQPESHVEGSEEPGLLKKAAAVGVALAGGVAMAASSLLPDKEVNEQQQKDAEKPVESNERYEKSESQEATQQSPELTADVEHEEQEVAVEQRGRTGDRCEEDLLETPEKQKEFSAIGPESTKNIPVHQTTTGEAVESQQGTATGIPVAESVSSVERFEAQQPITEDIRHEQYEHEHYEEPQTKSEQDTQHEQYENKPYEQEQIEPELTQEEKNIHIELPAESQDTEVQSEPLSPRGVTPDQTEKELEQEIAQKNVEPVGDLSKELEATESVQPVTSGRESSPDKSTLAFVNAPSEIEAEDAKEPQRSPEEEKYRLQKQYRRDVEDKQEIRKSIDDRERPFGIEGPVGTEQPSAAEENLEHPGKPESEVKESPEKESPDSQKMGLGTMIAGAALMSGKALIDKFKGDKAPEAGGYDDSDNDSDDFKPEGGSERVVAEVYDEPRKAEEAPTPAESEYTPEAKLDQQEVTKTSEVSEIESPKTTESESQGFVEPETHKPDSEQTVLEPEAEKTEVEEPEEGPNSPPPTPTKVVHVHEHFEEQILDHDGNVVDDVTFESNYDVRDSHTPIDDERKVSLVPPEHGAESETLSHFEEQAIHINPNAVPPSGTQTLHEERVETTDDLQQKTITEDLDVHVVPTDESHYHMQIHEERVERVENDTVTTTRDYDIEAPVGTQISLPEGDQPVSNIREQVEQGYISQQPDADMTESHYKVHEERHEEVIDKDGNTVTEMTTVREYDDEHPEPSIQAMHIERKASEVKPSSAKPVGDVEKETATTTDPKQAVEPTNTPIQDLEDEREERRKIDEEREEQRVREEQLQQQYQPEAYQNQYQSEEHQQQYQAEQTPSEVQEYSDEESGDTTKKMGLGTMIAGAAYLGGKAIYDKMKGDGKDKHPDTEYHHEELKENEYQQPEASEITFKDEPQGFQIHEEGPSESFKEDVTRKTEKQQPIPEAAPVSQTPLSQADNISTASVKNLDLDKLDEEETLQQAQAATENTQEDQAITPSTEVSVEGKEQKPEVTEYTEELPSGTVPGQPEEPSVEAEGQEKPSVTVTEQPQEPVSPEQHDEPHRTIVTESYEYTYTDDGVHEPHAEISYRKLSQEDEGPVVTSEEHYDVSGSEKPLPIQPDAGRTEEGSQKSDTISVQTEEVEPESEYQVEELPEDKSVQRDISPENVSKLLHEQKETREEHGDKKEEAADKVEGVESPSQDQEATTEEGQVQQNVISHHFGSTGELPQSVEELEQREVTRSPQPVVTDITDRPAVEDVGEPKATDTTDTTTQEDKSEGQIKEKQFTAEGPETQKIIDTHESRLEDQDQLQPFETSEFRGKREADQDVSSPQPEGVEHTTSSEPSEQQSTEFPETKQDTEAKSTSEVTEISTAESPVAPASISDVSIPEEAEQKKPEDAVRHTDETALPYEAKPVEASKEETSESEGETTEKINLGTMIAGAAYLGGKAIYDKLKGSESDEPEVEYPVEPKDEHYESPEGYRHVGDSAQNTPELARKQYTEPAKDSDVAERELQNKEVEQEISEASKQTSGPTEHSEHSPDVTEHHEEHSEPSEQASQHQETSQFDEQAPEASQQGEPAPDVTEERREGSPSAPETVYIHEERHETVIGAGGEVLKDIVETRDYDTSHPEVYETTKTNYGQEERRVSTADISREFEISPDDLPTNEEPKEVHVHEKHTEWSQDDHGQPREVEITDDFDITQTKTGAEAISEEHDIHVHEKRVEHVTGFGQETREVTTTRDYDIHVPEGAEEVHLPDGSEPIDMITSSGEEPVHYHVHEERDEKVIDKDGNLISDVQYVKDFDDEHLEDNVYELKNVEIQGEAPLPTADPPSHDGEHAAETDHEISTIQEDESQENLAKTETSGKEEGVSTEKLDSEGVEQHKPEDVVEGTDISFEQKPTEGLTITERVPINRSPASDIVEGVAMTTEHLDITQQPVREDVEKKEEEGQASKYGPATVLVGAAAYGAMKLAEKLTGKPKDQEEYNEYEQEYGDAQYDDRRRSETSPVGDIVKETAPSEDPDKQAEPVGSYAESSPSQSTTDYVTRDLEDYERAVPSGQRGDDGKVLESYDRAPEKNINVEPAQEETEEQILVDDEYSESEEIRPRPHGLELDSQEDLDLQSPVSLATVRREDTDDNLDLMQESVYVPADTPQSESKTDHSYDIEQTPEFASEKFEGLQEQDPMQQSMYISHDEGDQAQQYDNDEYNTTEEHVTDSHGDANDVLESEPVQQESELYPDQINLPSDTTPVGDIDRETKVSGDIEFETEPVRDVQHQTTPSAPAWSETEPVGDIDKEVATSVEAGQGAKPVVGPHEMNDDCELVTDTEPVLRPQDSEAEKSEVVESEPVEKTEEDQHEHGIGTMIAGAALMGGKAIYDKLKGKTSDEQHQQEYEDVVESSPVEETRKDEETPLRKDSKDEHEREMSREHSQAISTDSQVTAIHVGDDVVESQSLDIETPEDMSDLSPQQTAYDMDKETPEPLVKSETIDEEAADVPKTPTNVSHPTSEDIKKPTEAVSEKPEASEVHKDEEVIDSEPVHPESPLPSQLHDFKAEEDRFETDIHSPDLVESEHIQHHLHEHHDLPKVVDYSDIGEGHELNIKDEPSPQEGSEHTHSIAESHPHDIVESESIDIEDKPTPAPVARPNVISDSSQISPDEEPSVEEKIKHFKEDEETGISEYQDQFRPIAEEPGREAEEQRDVDDIVESEDINEEDIKRMSGSIIQKAQEATTPSEHRKSVSTEASQIPRSDMVDSEGVQDTKQGTPERKRSDLILSPETLQQDIQRQYSQESAQGHELVQSESIREEDDHQADIDNIDLKGDEKVEMDALAQSIVTADVPEDLDYEHITHPEHHEHDDIVQSSHVDALEDEHHFEPEGDVPYTEKPIDHDKLDEKLGLGTMMAGAVAMGAAALVDKITGERSDDQKLKAEMAVEKKLGEKTVSEKSVAGSEKSEAERLEEIGEPVPSEGFVESESIPSGDVSQEVAKDVVAQEEERKHTEAFKDDEQPRVEDKDDFDIEIVESTDLDSEKGSPRQEHENPETEEEVEHHEEKHDEDDFDVIHHDDIIDIQMTEEEIAQSAQLRASKSMSLSPHAKGTDSPTSTPLKDSELGTEVAEDELVNKLETIKKEEDTVAEKERPELRRVQDAEFERTDSAGSILKDRELTREDFGGDMPDLTHESESEDEKPTVERFDQPVEINIEEEPKHLDAFDSDKFTDEMEGERGLAPSEPIGRPHSPLPPRTQSVDQSGSRVDTQSSEEGRPIESVAEEEVYDGQLLADQNEAAYEAAERMVEEQVREEQEKKQQEEKQEEKKHKLSVDDSPSKVSQKTDEEISPSNESGSSNASSTVFVRKEINTDIKMKDSDDGSQSSLLEFERLEQELSAKQPSPGHSDNEQMVASATGSVNSLLEFENIEREVLEQHMSNEEAASQSIGPEVMILSDIREESEVEEMSIKGDDEDSLNEAQMAADAMITSADSLEPSGRVIRDANRMETSVDSLEPQYSGSRQQHDDSLLDEGTSGGAQSQDTQAVLSADTAGTFQEYQDDDRDSLEGALEDYETITTFQTVQQRDDGTTETITRKVRTRVTDPVHSHVRFTGTENEDRLRNIEPEQEIESVDEEGNITKTIRRRLQ
ncbi:unnamed protein product [Bursaphelenchus okinawaensis]|uniref:Uncharacterized protein n=1 Tax=Bursaphelenchus okinawaensis TaxID=465554 RepID=A0A811KT11_9BILA|nr:unnamed protein product [Bursaphelenchus okinawaensis]CAG9112176.1 unnamed protein product [Bursaphelenchus okinawaensis]